MAPGDLPRSAGGGFAMAAAAAGPGVELGGVLVQVGRRRSPLPGGRLGEGTAWLTVVCCINHDGRGPTALQPALGLRRSVPGKLTAAGMAKPLLQRARFFLKKIKNVFMVL